MLRQDTMMDSLRQVRENQAMINEAEEVLDNLITELGDTAKGRKMLARYLNKSERSRQVHSRKWAKASSSTKADDASRVIKNRMTGKKRAAKRWRESEYPHLKKEN